MLNLPVFGPCCARSPLRASPAPWNADLLGRAYLDGLSITARTAGNAVLERALMQVRKSIEEGRTYRRSSARERRVSQHGYQMIASAKHRRMDSMLQKIADFYEDEVDAATKDMLALMEPMLISFLASRSAELSSRSTCRCSP